MFRKFLGLLLILLTFMSVLSCCTPVYAEDYESYTLEPGKLYRFKLGTIVGSSMVEAEFSDYVLYSLTPLNYHYRDVHDYKYDNYINNNKSNYLNVFNTSSENVTVSITGVTINEVTLFEPPLSVVMYDATEMDFKIINKSDYVLTCKKFEYNGFGNPFDASGEFFTVSGSRILTGRGFALFEFSTSDVPYNLDFNGVYEVSDCVRSDFFPVPPWILRMDLAGMIRVLLDQLSMLLPVALVILSVFLVVSLLIYIVHLFL